MRGPGYRLDLDCRRTWRCPSCGAERHLLGTVTQVTCGCAAAAYMQLVAERLAAPRPVIEFDPHAPRVSKMSPEDEPLPVREPRKPKGHRNDARPAPLMRSAGLSALDDLRPPTEAAPADNTDEGEAPAEPIIEADTDWHRPALRPAVAVQEPQREPAREAAALPDASDESESSDDEFGAGL